MCPAAAYDTLLTLQKRTDDSVMQNEADRNSFYGNKKGFLMNRIMMALMAMALSVPSSAVFAEDDAANTTNRNTAPMFTPDLAAPSQDRTAVRAPGPDAQTSVPNARAAAPSQDRAVRALVGH